MPPLTTRILSFAHLHLLRSWGAGAMGQGVLACRQQPAAAHPSSPPLQASAAASPTHDAIDAPTETVPEPFRLDWAGSEAEVRAALCARASAALPAEHDAAGGLKRTVLRCLLERSLSQRADGSFEMRAVLAAQLGHAVSAQLPSVPAAQRALYKTPGHDLKRLLASLQGAGIVSVTLVHSTKYAAVRGDWLLQLADAAHTSATAAAAAAPAASADQQVNGLNGSLSLDIDLSNYPTIVTDQTGASPAHVAFCFTIAISKRIPGRRCSIGAVRVGACKHAWMSY